MAMYLTQIIQAKRYNFNQIRTGPLDLFSKIHYKSYQITDTCQLTCITTFFITETCLIMVLVW